MSVTLLGEAHKRWRCCSFENWDGKSLAEDSYNHSVLCERVSLKAEQESDKTLQNVGVILITTQRSPLYPCNAHAMKGGRNYNVHWRNYKKMVNTVLRKFPLVFGCSRTTEDAKCACASSLRASRRVSGLVYRLVPVRTAVCNPLPVHTRCPSIYANEIRRDGETLFGQLISLARDLWSPDEMNLYPQESEQDGGSFAMAQEEEEPTPTTIMTILVSDSGVTRCETLGAKGLSHIVIIQEVITEDETNIN
ncbi:hypothetical protein CBL_03454 [Carabus blaptoides fortunei]